MTDLKAVLLECLMRIICIMCLKTVNLGPQHHSVHFQSLSFKHIRFHLFRCPHLKVSNYGKRYFLETSIMLRYTIVFKTNLHFCRQRVTINLVLFCLFVFCFVFCFCFFQKRKNCTLGRIFENFHFWCVLAVFVCIAWRENQTE